MFCRIVGKVLTPKPDISMLVAEVGKEISVNSRSFCEAKLFTKLVNELFCTSDGNPQDMGVRSAQAGIASRVRTMAPTINGTNLF